MQNTLLFVAISELPAPIFMVLYGNFDIIFWGGTFPAHFPAHPAPHTAPHTACAMLHLVPKLIGC